MMHRFIAITSFALLAQAATAQEDCVKIEDPDDRLNCYDQSFKVTEVVETESDWSVRTDKSKLDDTMTVVMHLSSEGQIPKRFGGSGNGDMLIRCMENTTALYFKWGGHFMADIQGKGRVDYRIDADPASRANMQVSTDNEALGLWNGGASIPLIKKLFGGSNLYVRATPFNESPIEMTFNISGTEEAITPLREACGW